ncbi:MAG TPA: DUF928 domain-containing protein [Tepidisphaeraceae bacterium]|jgi:hypothetical protein|nr:DUF928 domain-containing protein [Tepidisphaeraceae bacterium]
MTRTNILSLQFTAAFVLALPLLLRADNPASGIKFDYSKPAGVTDNSRNDWKSGRGGKQDGIPDNLMLRILCPKHTGLTVQDHPSIFWFMDKPVTGKYKCRFSITNPNDVEPLFEKDIDPKTAVGIQRMDLKDLTKPLQSNTAYEVSVTIIVPTDQPNEPHSSAEIKRIAAPERLISKLLTRPTPAERAVVYAHDKIWYDALAAISDQIVADPKNAALHQERAELLRQGELPDAAHYDESLAK